MAWIKTLDGKLVDAREFVLTSAGGGGGKGKTEIRCGAILCGAYRTPAITQTVKDEIEVWLKAGENGVFSMPSEAEICGERSQDDAMPFHFHGGSWNNFWIDLPKHIKEYFVSVPGGIEAYERNGNGHCFYLRVRCPVCGRKGRNVSGLCPKCMSERICATCQHKRNSEACMCCIYPEHSKWAPKTVQDVKIFPAHDASKPIYGAFTTEPGDIIEVLVGGETLTCKVTKTVRKTHHGTFTTRLGE